MNFVDLEEVKKFYNETPEIWAKNDAWHQWSLKQIKAYIARTPFPLHGVILNAGSGGNDYGIACKKMVHIDIAEKKLIGIPNAVVSSIESMPFGDSVFDGIVCVGSVINYCDAGAAIAEFARVLKPTAMLILEFENSAGFEYRKQAYYRSSATVVTVQFQGKAHTQWLYSVPYIKRLLNAYGFTVQSVFPYHILSSLALSLSQNESVSTSFAKIDPIFRHFRPLASHANNLIMKCYKS